jgi:D-cysteine desulfhydrase family pyridoxal phosphate-dependent enzyme
MQLIENLLKPFPREIISVLPTPFHRLNQLSEILKCNLYIKRDDLTGFAFGGNKTRKLDFLIAEMIEKGYDAVIGIGANQSNFCRILANAGVKYGLSVHLILRGKKVNKPTGNLLLDQMLGANIHHVDSDDPEIISEEVLQVKNRLEYEGKKVFLLPPGGSIPIGALGYVAGWSELLDDFERNQLKVDMVIHASSSAGTQAGLVVGQAISQWPGQIIGISVDYPRNILEKNVYELANSTASLMNINVPREIVRADDGFVGRGYAIPTPGCEEAVDLFAKNEGIFLDYVYTGKAAAGLIEYCRSGRIDPQDTVVFIHTGGNIELFE